MRKDTLSLEKIIYPIKEDLSLFKSEFKNALKSDVTLINLISRFLIRNKGKKIRPSLTLLCARLCGDVSKNTYRSAAMMELMHVATLIHDDIVDDAELRRGRPALHRIWKNKLSVLMGDYLFSKALINMVKIKNFDALDLISETAEELSAGEILQIEKSFTRRMNSDVYFKMIDKKTASLISTSCELGAITTTASDEDRKSTREYGTALGMAFQIKDDLFDLLGSTEDTGKDSGSDVKTNMVTLPILLAYENMKSKDIKLLKNKLKNKNKSKVDIKEIKNIVEENNGFEGAKLKLEEFSNKAIASIKRYPDSIYKTSLINLVHFNSSRVK